MRFRKSFLLFGVALGCLVALVFIVGSHGRGGREARLANIEKTRSLASKVAQYESSPVVQAVSKATKVDPTDYLLNKVSSQEKAASQSGDLISMSIWAPALHTRTGWQDFMLRSRTNSAHFVGWSLSEDDLLTGYVRPEEVGIWQDEFSMVTNSVPWAERRIFKLVGKNADCLLPDGSHVGVDQLKKWLDESIAQGWWVGVSLVQGDSSVLLGSRKRPRREPQQSN